MVSERCYLMLRNVAPACTFYEEPHVKFWEMIIILESVLLLSIYHEVFNQIGLSFLNTSSFFITTIYQLN